MSKKIRIFLLGCALMVMCCMGITAGASDNAKVIAHNLTITDEGISVNFYVDIDVEAQNDIKVTLNGSQVEIPAEPTKIIIDAKAYSCYKFTQPVVAKEMDDKVSLSIVAGEEELVTDSYSVNDYVAEVQAGGYGYNFENLANAMTYYGEFAEVYLKYNNATSASEKALASIDGFNEDVLDAYAMTKGSEYPEGLTYYGTQLNLNSEITLRLCFQLADGKTAADYSNITAVSTDGTKDLGVLKKGSYKDTQYYYVDIANVGADALGKSYEIKADNKTLLSNCSVLSYASAVVKKYGNDAAKADLANLSKALYLYSEKANLYVESKLVAVYDIFYGSGGFSATPDEFTPVYLTGNGDVTTESTGNMQVTMLSQLNDSRTKGCSVWMQSAYTPSEEVLTGPYVIRRYTNNINVLNITGTATLEVTVDGSLGQFAAQYPGGITKVEISQADNGEVYVSGTLNVTGNAKTGVIKASNADVTINAEGLTAQGEVVFPNHKTQKLTGHGAVSAIKLEEHGHGHFGAYETAEGLNLGSVICGCGANVSQDPNHSCGWTDAQGEVGIQAAYALDWKATTSLPTDNGSFYLTQNLEGLTARTDKNNNNVVNLDLNGKTVSGSGSSGNLYRIRKGTLNIANSQGDGAITMTEGINTAGVVYVNGTAASLNIFGGSISANAGTPVLVNTGCINMHGGTIIGSTNATEIVVSSSNTSLNFTGANAVQVGLMADATDSAELNVKGGIIEGEVLIGTNAASSVTISGKARVGVADENDTDKAYGVGTSSLVTEVQTITGADVKADAKIVLKDKDKVTVTGYGEALPFVIQEGGDGHGHYGVVNYNDGTYENALKMASIICGCGDNIRGKVSHDNCAWLGEEDISKVHEINWKPWTQTTSLPNTEGSYYLTQNLKDIAAEGQIKAQGKVVNLDLAGYTIEGAETFTGFLFRVQTGTLNIADSSEKQTGAIKHTGATNKYGAVSAWGGTNNLTYLNIFGGTISAEAGTTVSVRQGHISMYGGTIIGAAEDGKTDLTFVPANAMQVGTGNFIADLTVCGGTIKGEVLMGPNKSTEKNVIISGDSKVGIEAGKDESGNVIPYGIGITGTSAQTIDCKDVTADARVVLKNIDDVTVSGTGEGSAFTLLETSRNTIIDDKADGIGNLKLGAYMCVCGKMDGNYDHTDGCKQPDYAWQPWTQTTSLPNTEGSYYLTQNLKDIAAEGQIKAQGKVVNLDLAGYTIEGAETFTGFLFRVQTGTLNIADSSEKQTGAIKHIGATNKYGAVSAWGGTNNLTYLNIFGGTISAEAGTTASVRQGHISMYGGTIIGAAEDGQTDWSFVPANAMQVGAGNYTADLTVCGGTIKGEVLMGPNKSTEKNVTISGDSKVGIVDEDDATKAYGIGITGTSAQTIDCKDVTADASVVLKNSHDVTVSGTGEGSAFSIIDQHNKVVDDNDEGIGNLSFAPQMCVCGAVGEHTQVGNCAVPENGAWKALSSWSISNTASGSYYLINDITASSSLDFRNYQIDIDLVGYTIDAEGSVTYMFQPQKTSVLNITDSVGGGVIKNAYQGEETAYGTVILLPNGTHTDACANLYAGTLTSAGGTLGVNTILSTVYIGVGTFSIYGGTVEDNLDENKEDDFMAVRNVNGTINAFQAGYGKVDISPAVGVSLGSYGNQDTRLTTEVLTPLEAVATAVTDLEGNTLILVVTDLSWGKLTYANQIRDLVYDKYGIPKENVLVGGTHNHSAPDPSYTSNANVTYVAQWKTNVMSAIDKAMKNRQPATMEVGSTETVDMVFSRRYLCEDGLYQGGGPASYDQTTAAVTAHETEADEEIQMLRFVRQGAKDILITQWQSHACNISWDRTEGSDHYKASGEWPQVIRSTLETELGVHCMYMQGAAGNLASMSEIEGENLYNAESDPEAGTIGYNDFQAIGKEVASYVIDAYQTENGFKKVESGLIQVNQYNMPAILRESGSEATGTDMPQLNTVAIGDVSLVTLPSELFDTSAVEVKTATPFEMTLIMGYTCGGVGYEAPAWAVEHGCYEVEHGKFELGTAEDMVNHYIDTLKTLYATK